MTPPRKRAEAPPEEHAPIDAKQLRQLHALLHGHGITSDQARHDWLTTRLDRPIATATEVSKVEAAQIIAELEAEDAPEVHTLTSRNLTKLRREFPSEAIGKLPRSTCKACSDSPRKRCQDHTWVSRCRECGNSHSSATMHIDYVGHADVTARLLEVDPTWSWRPFTADELAGIPPSLREGGLWIMLTVCGVSRPGFGEASGGRQSGGEAVKVIIGDALRNAAMRFGVALDLWAKGDREWAHTEKHGADDMAPDEAPPVQDQPQEPWTGPTVEDSIARLIQLAGDQGTDLAGITGKFREAHSLTVDDLAEKVPPHALAGLVQQVEAYIAQQAEAAHDQAMAQQDAAGMPAATG